ncbi:MAG TPA: DUF5947 family protein [Jatrophihabitans sp.]|nr:DUF5947 family protein [Jatrophihabitans sp.]
MSGPGAAIGLLQRLAAGPGNRPDRARCEMCGAPTAAEHRHVVDLETRKLLCTCRPCALLFTLDQARLRYRAVPEDYAEFPGELPPGLWDELQIPVSLAFLFTNSALGRAVAFYPGPAGATESELPLGAWEAAVAGQPALGLVRPDVEAVLLRAPATGGVRCHLVPIDRCYELVGRLRRAWRGFDGGGEARAELAGFLAELDRRSVPAETLARLRGPS